MAIEKIVTQGYTQEEAIAAFNEILAQRSGYGTRRGRDQKGEEPIQGIISITFEPLAQIAGDSIDGYALIAIVSIVRG